MVKLHKQKNGNSIQVHELVDGQLAVITNWPTPTNYIGWIVMWHRNDLLAIGRNDIWSDYRNVEKSTECRVRILEKGELIEII